MSLTPASLQEDCQRLADSFQQLPALLQTLDEGQGEAFITLQDNPRDSMARALQLAKERLAEATAAVAAAGEGEAAAAAVKVLRLHLQWLVEVSDAVLFPPSPLLIEWTGYCLCSICFMVLSLTTINN